MRWDELHREPCSLARTLAIIGDRWTLLIIRDCFLGVRRFEGFEASLQITRHVLSDRLRKLVEAGVLARVPYQERPKREEYRLTEMGLDLYPVVLTMLQWGDKHLADEDGPPIQRVHKTCGQVTTGELVCSACGDPLEARQIRILPSAQDASPDEARPTPERAQKR